MSTANDFIKAPRLSHLVRVAAWLRYNRLGFYLLLAPMLLGSTHLLAQAQNSGTVSGRVSDSSGAFLPRALITLRSQEQGRLISVTSNSFGEYVINDVPVSRYTITFQAPAFASYSVRNAEVNAGEDVRVNAELRPAAASATVSVEAESLTVDTQSATIGVTIDNDLVDNLPLDGNNVVNTAALLPGVTDVNAPTTFTNDQGGPTYNISGARANQNLFLLDGAVWNNLYSNTGLNFPPRQALQEVSVLLNNYKAQYGRNVGSVFNVITKSGANAVHGQFWEFAQNRAFNAADYLSHANPKLVQNQFGAQFSGPLVHERLFFSLAYQDLRSAATVTAQAQTPTVSERGLSVDGSSARPCVTPAYAAAGYTCATFTEDATSTLHNPLKYTAANVAGATTALQTAWVTSGHTGVSPCVTFLANQGKTLPNAELPSICFNPVSVAFLQRLPIPTIFLPGVSIPYAVSQASQPRNDQGGLARVDWLLTHHTLSARYYQTDANDRTANGVSSGTGVANYEINANLADLDFGELEDTWTLRSNLLNQMRIAYKRYVYSVLPTDTSTLASFGAVLAQPGHDALPRISINSRVAVGSVYLTYARAVNEDVQADDSLSWTHGTHDYRFGAEYLRPQYLHDQDQSPSIEFSSNYTGVPAADYMLGLIATSTFGNSVHQAAIQQDLYLYAQDDWRLTPRLTLNYGLRYEIPFEWFQPEGQAATFIPGYQSVVYPTAPANIAFVGDPGVPKSLVGTSYTNVAPRLGFAYDLFGSGRMTLRGGFGIFYDAINALVVGTSQPYHYQATYGMNTGGFSQPLLGLSAIPANYVKGQAPQFVTPFSITYPDPNFTTPYSEAMNLGFQEKIRHSTILEVNYVGRMGRHLALGMDQNPAIYDCSGTYFHIDPVTYCTGAAASTASYAARVRYPNFNPGGTGVLDYMTVGSSSYNAAQALLTVRASGKLTMLASYTFSKSLDVSSNGTGITNSTDQPTLDAHRAVSDFNAAHILNLGFVLSEPRLTLSNAWERAVLNGWSFAGIYNARTGHPFSTTDSGDVTLRDERVEYTSFVPGGYTPLPSNRERLAKVAQWFNTADVINQASGTFGNTPRNFFIGPAFINTTLSLRRSFALPRRETTFDLRVDAFNAFNTPNLGQPSAVESGTASKNGTFGSILATVGGNGAVGTNGRRLQLSGSLRF